MTQSILFAICMAWLILMGVLLIAYGVHGLAAAINAIGG